MFIQTKVRNFKAVLKNMHPSTDSEYMKEACNTMTINVQIFWMLNAVGIHDHGGLSCFLY